MAGSFRRLVRNMRKNQEAAGHLPRKFSDDERAAYRWLYDCGVNGWLVDLVTKKVTDYTGAKWASLVAFARSHGRK